MLFRKRTLAFIFTGIFLLGFGTFNVALHPNMDQWKQEKLVITQVKTQQKAVALTFDDGPDPARTPVVLANLQKHNVHATFFVVGNRAEKYPELLQQIAAQGHEIANHSYTHNYAAFQSNKAEVFQEEIDKTNSIIKNLTAQTPSLFRPPGGYLSDSLVEFTKQNQITIAYWSWQQDSKDWKVGNSSSSIASHIIQHIQPGQIILLHDGGDNGLQTAQAVDMLLTQLMDEGYQFITMSELIKLGDKE
ncbi:MAG: polysaccharide deacetylase family protein [Syntrophomonadaceae bacterium]|nr:polysaccharide deacetylase family protein [Syntrophomonadaceae bacterium]